MLKKVFQTNFNEHNKVIWIDLVVISFTLINADADPLQSFFIGRTLARYNIFSKIRLKDLAF